MLLQLRVLGFGLLQDGDVGGVFVARLRIDRSMSEITDYNKNNNCWVALIQEESREAGGLFLTHRD